jgi:hypothetical protein
MVDKNMWACGRWSDGSPATKPNTLKLVIYVKIFK